MRLRAAPSSKLPRGLSLGEALGSPTPAFCVASKPPRWDRCRALGFECFGDGLEARQAICSSALRSARLHAHQPVSDLDLTEANGSLPVQPVISGPGQLLTSNRQEGDLDNDRYGSRADIDERPFEGLLFGSGRSRASGACRRQMRAVGLPLDLSNRQCWPSAVMDRNNRGVGDAAVAVAVCSGRTRAGTAKRSLHTSNSACTIVGWGDHSWTVDGTSGGTRPE